MVLPNSSQPPEGIPGFQLSPCSQQALWHLIQQEIKRKKGQEKRGLSETTQNSCPKTYLLYYHPVKNTVMIKETENNLSTFTVWYSAWHFIQIPWVCKFSACRYKRLTEYLLEEGI